MNVNEKNNIIREAQQQTAALKKISRWKMIAMAVSTLGVALAYAGFAGFIQSPPLGVLGVAVTVIAAGAALIFNLGLKNGRRNRGARRLVGRGHFIFHQRHLNGR